jgi:hypothetical protein
MSIVEVKVSLSHRSLMNKSKYDLASLVMQQNDQATRIIQGMMEIAELAMPDSYFQSDSRVNAARAWLGHDDA